MADKEETLKRMIASGVVAVIRLDDASQLIRVSEALKAGGVESIEFTMTTPGALDIMSQVAKEFGDAVLLGAGTVLDSETARAAILAGAEFVVGPTLNVDVITVCRRYNKIVVPGTLTPTEILTAWEAGADMIKVFPAGAMGPGYLKDIRGPLPQVKLMPTGGISLENAADFIKAGAVVIGVGGNLVDKKAIKTGRFDLLAERARQFVEVVREAKA
jgi:2-dehydro-3-deoxyphosphogluconate aldolase/(4S)-4-hydroxy-2-oxoglutarate aldolase